MDNYLETLYLLILMLIMWSISFVIGIMLSNDVIMVIFFWIASIFAIIFYAAFYRKKKDISILKRELILLIPIWLFLIYQSYVTIRNVHMTSAERWALIPFVLGLGFYVALLKQHIEKKGK